MASRTVVGPPSNVDCMTKTSIAATSRGMSDLQPAKTMTMLDAKRSRLSLEALPQNAITHDQKACRGKIAGNVGRHIDEVRDTFARVVQARQRSDNQGVLGEAQLGPRRLTIEVGLPARQLDAGVDHPHPGGVAPHLLTEGPISRAPRPRQIQPRSLNRSAASHAA